MYTIPERILNSGLAMVKYIFQQIQRPLLITISLVLIYIIILILKNRGKDIKARLDIRKIAKLFFTSLYFCFLVEITLLHRVGIPQNPPLSEVWTGWSIFETDMIMYVDSTPVINIVMMMPMALITKYVIKIKDKYILKTMLLSLSSSVIIESCQVIFRLGTLQVSDLTYNTIGGAIGCLAILLIIKLYNNHKQKKSL